ncbi:MAG: polysaccharide deacetylase family protein [Sporichthyaceae bacterium]
MPLSRRDLLRASAAAALTAACSPASSDASGPRGSASPDTAAPSDSSTSASSGPPPSGAGSAAPAVGSRPAREVDHGPRTSPLVALTFHGNGDPALAMRLLRVLSDHQAQATVMAVGTWLRAEPRMAGRILDAGHDLGNHTLHHYPMRSLSAATAFSEIRGCARTLHRLTGSRGTWFRASGTQATTTTIRREAGRAGYDRCISYDVDGLDWQDPSTSTVERAVLGHSRAGSIISLHLGHQVTVDALPTILAGLHDKGLRPVTLTELLA